MSKEKQITELFNKAVKLSTFSPDEGDSIFLTVDVNKIDAPTASEWV